MPLAGFMCSRFGCRRVIVAATAIICLVLPTLAVASSLPLLVATLFLFGAAIGSVDCAVNVQAVIVERASGRALMSGFHGSFSVGGIAAAAGVSSLLALGATPLIAVIGVVAVIIALLLSATPNLLPRAVAAPGSTFAIPRGAVLFIGMLCFIAFLTEGTALDWSAVFLASVRGVSAAYAGRLTGDRVVGRLGGRRVIMAGALCAAAGLALATLVSAWEAAILGYALVGIGCSNIVPVLYTAVGRQTVMPEHAAVPAITTMGYAGILVGPAAIGFLAHVSSLSVALLAVAALLLAVAQSGRFLRV
jgi:MFS family permease